MLFSERRVGAQVENNGKSSCHAGTVNASEDSNNEFRPEGLVAKQHDNSMSRTPRVVSSILQKYMSLRLLNVSIETTKISVQLQQAVVKDSGMHVSNGSDAYTGTIPPAITHTSVGAHARPHILHGHQALGTASPLQNCLTSLVVVTLDASAGSVKGEARYRHAHIAARVRKNDKASTASCPSPRPSRGPCVALRFTKIRESSIRWHFLSTRINSPMGLRRISCIRQKALGRKTWGLK